jgi:hypothetical protein
MPITGEESVFQALFKWGAKESQEENFYSKSLYQFGMMTP